MCRLPCALIAALFLLATVVFGCEKRSAEKSALRMATAATQPYEHSVRAGAEAGPKVGFSGSAKQPADQNAGGGAKQPEAPPVERKIIFTADVQLVVTDVGKAEQELYQLLQNTKGFVTQSEVTGLAGATRTGTWKLRVPAAKFTEFREAVKKLGDLIRYTSNSNEVTEEYYDLAVRIKNKEAEVDKIRQYLDKISGKPDEALPVVRELSRATEELERMKGRQRVLDNLTELTTITLSMQEKGTYLPPAPPAPPEVVAFDTTLERTFYGSLDILIIVGKALTVAAVAASPWLPVVAVIGLPGWFIVRRRKSAAAIQVSSPAGVEVPKA